MSRLEDLLNAKLNERAGAGNLRGLTTQRAAADFFSNDYLGWATTGLLNHTIHQLFPEAGATGSTGSRLLSGNTPETEELERTIARFHKAEAALLYNSGYDANTGLLSAIALKNTIVLYDELCHASIIDGLRLGLCNKYKFRHNSIDDLAEKLSRFTNDGPLIVVVESVYSMDGDLAPLALITQLCTAHNAQLVVDEAHATGVFGANGEGLVVALGLQEQVFARVHTFGKALGCHGAAVVGGTLLKNYLVNFSRQFIYTTALPPHSVQAIACAYHLLAAKGFSNQPLNGIITYFRHKVAESGIAGYKDSISPVQAIVTGSNASAKALAAKMQASGLQVKAILSPTVPQGSERLRICLHSFNTREQIDILSKVLGD